MRKEMDEAMKDLDTEARRMMNSLGIKMPLTKKMKQTMAGVVDAQLQQAWEDEERIVPKKDAKRIAALPSALLTAAPLPAFFRPLIKR